MHRRRHTHESIGSHLRRSGISRRDFLELCGRLMAAAPFGLALTNVARAQDVAREIAKAKRPSVVWLHFQDCTGCTETLLRSTQPDLAELIFHLISLDYHETVMAAAGHDAERALKTAITENPGRYICIVEGSIPTRDQGIYLKLAGRPGLEVLQEVCGGAAAVIAIGSCASWGGVPSADPNPTGAVGADLRQADHQSARLSAQSLCPAGHRSSVCPLRHAARARRRATPAFRLRSHHPRSMPTASALRRRALRALVRRRRSPAGLVSLPSRLQGAGHPRAVLGDAFQ